MTVGIVLLVLSDGGRKVLHRNHQALFERMSEVSLALFMRFAHAGALMMGVVLMTIAFKAPVLELLKFVCILCALFMFAGVIVNEIMYYYWSRVEVNQNESV